MKTAVILAAGMGTRLSEAHPDAPKGFLQLNGRPVIEDSVFRLEQVGVRKIIIVTGFGADHYEKLAMRNDGLITTVHNPRYEESGSLYSLYCARDLVDEGFLLLESDLIYESRALDALTGHEYSDAVLLSGPTGAGDEVFVEAPTGLLVNMAKDRATLGSVAGELVGISKISRGLFALMKHMAAKAFESSLQLDYETDGLVAVAASWEIACPVVSDLVWAEIDDPGQLQRAKEQILPRLSLE